jgi:hypothetical protein
MQQKSSVFAATQHEIFKSSKVKQFQSLACAAARPFGAKLLTERKLSAVKLFCLFRLLVGPQFGLVYNDVLEMGRNELRTSRRL